MSGNQKQHQNLQTQKAAKTRKAEQKSEHRFNVAQMVDAPETLNSEDILAAQQQVGNQVVQRALDKKARDRSVTDEQGNLKPKIAATIQQKRGNGTPLPDEIRKDVSKKLGKDFKNVRIHTDETADKLSRTISARAFTIGSDIFFKNGVFAPGTSQGRETLIHELTHVVQQSGSKGGKGRLKLGAPDTVHERQADQMGKKNATSTGPVSGAVQRVAEEDELQMQSEEEELQMQSEEEELQMQSEEEELQMQPDTGGVIQRDEEHDERVKMRKMMGMGDLKGSKLKQVSKAQRVKKGALGNIKAKATSMNLGSDEHMGKLNDLEKGTKSQAKESFLAGLTTDEGKKNKQARMAKNIKDKATSMNLGSKEHMEKLSNLEKRTKSQDKRSYLAGLTTDEGKKNKETREAENTKLKAQEKEKFEKTVPGQRLKLMGTLKDPNASPEDIKAAKEKLNTLHKGAFSKKQMKTAGKERKTALKTAAQTGDEEAYEKLKSEQGESKKAKAGRFFKKAGKATGKGLLSVGKWAGGKALNFGTTKLNQGINHILGIQDEDKSEDKGSEKPSAPSGSSAGGGGGGGGMAETISDLFQENKKLKAQIAELTEKKEKEQAPV